MTKKETKGRQGKRESVFAGAGVQVANPKLKLILFI